MMRDSEETSKDINECGSKCNVSGTLEIFKEFNEVYRERLKKTEEACGDATQLKLKTLEDWVADLTEQNTVLVETVEALEKEALYRLELGINAGKTTSTSTRCDTSYNTIKGECRVCRTKTEVNSNGICNKPKCRALTMSTSGNEVFYQSQRDSQLLEAEEKLQKAELEIEKLRKDLNENELKVEKIKEEIIASEKSAKEMRAALTAEVADKHDQVLALRRDVQHLEEKLRQADMQTHFKDDIIKELRKEIKIANNKLHYLAMDAIPIKNKSSNCALIPSTTNYIKKNDPPVLPESILPSSPESLTLHTVDNKEYTFTLQSLKFESNKSSSVQETAPVCYVSLNINKASENDNIIKEDSVVHCSEYDIANDNIKDILSCSKDAVLKDKHQRQMKKLSKKINNKSCLPQHIDKLDYSCGDCNKNFKNNKFIDNNIA